MNRNKIRDAIVTGYLLEPAEAIRRAVNIAATFGSCSGERQKAWVIDQMIRILYRGDYKRGFLHSQCYTNVGQIIPYLNKGRGFSAVLRRVIFAYSERKERLVILL